MMIQNVTIGHHSKIRISSDHKQLATAPQTATRQAEHLIRLLELTGLIKNPRTKLHAESGLAGLTGDLTGDLNGDLTGDLTGGH